MKHLAHWFYYGKLRFLGRIRYNLTIASELFWHHLTNFQKKPESVVPLSNLTAVVKTFERPKILKRLIKSIRRMYPTLQIIVADDSRNPVVIPDVQIVNLPFNSGVSAGRNAALRAVNTKYILLLDDDFVFYNHTILEDALGFMETNSNVDILGGKVINLPFYKSTDYSQLELFPTDATPVMPIGTRIGTAQVLDKVANFYIGRTESIRKIGWDENLKRLDHADFFTRARGILTVAYFPKMQILHAQNLFDDRYQKSREDDAFDRALLYHRYYRKQQ
jgi:glycosyltransferase involved in cell wall biosynthesis